MLPCPVNPWVLMGRLCSIPVIQSLARLLKMVANLKAATQKTEVGFTSFESTRVAVMNLLNIQNPGVDRAVKE